MACYAEHDSISGSLVQYFVLQACMQKSSAYLLQAFGRKGSASRPGPHCLQDCSTADCQHMRLTKTKTALKSSMTSTGVACLQFKDSVSSSWVAHDGLFAKSVIAYALCNAETKGGRKGSRNTPSWRSPILDLALLLSHDPAGPSAEHLAQSGGCCQCHAATSTIGVGKGQQSWQWR